MVNLLGIASRASRASAFLAPSSLFPSSPARAFFQQQRQSQTAYNGYATNNQTTLARYGLIGGIAALFGVAVLGATSSATAKMSEQTVSRIRSTYLYTISGLATSALTVVAMGRTGLAYRVAMMNPFVFMAGSLITSVAASYMVQTIAYNNTVPKHAAMLLFHAAIGAGLSPLFYLGQTVLLQAAAATALMVTSLSVVAATSPPQLFMEMTGPLTVGLGVVVAASFGRLFFPASSMLLNVCLYGGLAVFGGLTMADTQAIYHKAAVRGYGGYDPINESIHLYLNSINIFTRMAMIFSGQTRRK